MMVVVAGLIVEAGRILIAQRPLGGWMEGYWEFPGGKIDPGEGPREALVRELHEEIGVKVEVGEIEEVLEFRYSDREVLLLFFWCRILSGQPHGRESQALAWATPEEMKGFRFLPADEPLIGRLAAKEISGFNPRVS